MIYIVSGFMRSGTSMMMEALKAGGLDIVKSESRRKVNILRSDNVYSPNPNDLYEPDFRKWGLTSPREYDGKAIKVVAPFVQNLCVHEYRVVFMLRDPEEIRQSFRAAFYQELSTKNISDSTREALAHLQNRKDTEVKTLEYKEVLKNPEDSFESLKWPIDVKAAATVPNNQHYRFASEKLVYGL